MDDFFLRRCCSRGIRSTVRRALLSLGAGSAPCGPPQAVDSLFLPPEPAADLPSAPHRVLYLIHSFFPESQGGTEAFLARLSASQSALGNTVCILTFSSGFLWEYPEKQGDFLVRRYEWAGVPVIAVRYRHPPAGLFYERISDADAAQTAFARRFLSDFQPDLVHAVYPQPFGSFLRVCRETGVPYLLTLTDFCMLCPRGTLTENGCLPCSYSGHGARCPGNVRVRFAAAERTIRGAAAAAVPSLFSAERFAAELPGLQPCIIPHAPEPGILYRRRSAVRRFAFLGTWTPAKGAALLANAFHHLPGSISLDIYGGGPLEPFLRVRSLQDSRIRLHGPVSRESLPRCYDQADCVVVPSQCAESFSLTLNEAAAAGCMVIASDLGALPQRALAANGSVFLAGDEDSLLRTLQRAIAAPSFPAEPPAIFPEAETAAYEKLYCKAVHP